MINSNDTKVIIHTYIHTYKSYFSKRPPQCCQIHYSFPFSIIKTTKDYWITIQTWSFLCAFVVSHSQENLPHSLCSREMHHFPASIYMGNLGNHCLWRADNSELSEGIMPAVFLLMSFKETSPERGRTRRDTPAGAPASLLLVSSLPALHINMPRSAIHFSLSVSVWRPAWGESLRSQQEPQPNTSTNGQIKWAMFIYYISINGLQKPQLQGAALTRIYFGKRDSHIPIKIAPALVCTSVFVKCLLD